MVTFGVFEGYLAAKNNSNTNRITYVNIGSVLKKYWARDDILGYTPIKNNSAQSTQYRGKDLVYDVVYTIDKNGLRISPPYKKDNLGCIVFFGGSFTFGEGVADEETLPFLTGKKTDGQYRVYNFGFHGYGPHQMLSALEKGLVEEIVACKPKFAIYQALTYHAERSAGKTNWDVHGPKYELSKDGEVLNKGHFDGEYFVNSKRVITQLKKSLIIDRIWNKYYRSKQKHINDDDIKLFIGIVSKAREIFEARYPGSEFHIIFWDYDNKGIYADIMGALKKKGLIVHPVSQINPDIFNYVIGNGDPHPDPLAYDLIAEYLTSRVISP